MTTITISVLMILAFLAGAAAALTGVWLGGLVKQESALRVENQHQTDEISRLRADGLLAEGRIELLRETIDRQEKQLEQRKAEEAAKGEVVDLGDETGGMADRMMAGLIGAAPDPGPLPEIIMAQNKRLSEQLAKAANPEPGTPEEVQ